MGIACCVNCTGAMIHFRTIAAVYNKLMVVPVSIVELAVSVELIISYSERDANGS